MGCSRERREREKWDELKGENLTEPDAEPVGRPHNNVSPTRHSPHGAPGVAARSPTISRLAHRRPQDVTRHRAHPAYRTTLDSIVTVGVRYCRSVHNRFGTDSLHHPLRAPPLTTHGGPAHHQTIKPAFCVMDNKLSANCGIVRGEKRGGCLCTQDARASGHTYILRPLRKLNVGSIEQDKRKAIWKYEVE